MTKILKGAEVVEELNAKIQHDAEELKARGVVPKLAIVRVGEKPDQLSYERGATKRCAMVGVESEVFALPDNATQQELLDAIARLNGDGLVHGILLLSPLPKRFDYELIRNSIACEKDVDGIGDENSGRLFSGAEDSFAPCTAQASLEILKHYGVPLDGKRAVVVGRSLIVGKPASILLLDSNATVTICHSHTQDLPAICRGADVLVVAIGRAKFVGADCFAPGQTVIDVGINYDEEAQKLVGDVDYEAALGVVDAITPVPGGTGSVTTSVLVSHVVAAAQRVNERWEVLDDLL